MVVSLKANKKRVIAFLILVVAVVGACIFLRSGGEETEEPQVYLGGTNEERVTFLQSFGWEITVEPAETREVMIPAEFNDVYTTYNVMQKAQGFDLKPYAGQVCTQYKYQINNYPDETEVYATLLVYGGEIIGGDVACSKAAGFMHGFAKDSARYGETARSKTKETSSAVSSECESSLPESSCMQSEAESSAVEGDAEPMESDVSGVVSEASGVESTAGEIYDEDIYPTD